MPLFKNSVALKFLTQITTPHGPLNIYEYIVQISGVRLVIHAPWEIIDFAGWLSKIQLVADTPGLSSHVLELSYPDFTENIVHHLGGVWECEARAKGIYEYISYKSVGENFNALQILRAAVHTDDQWFRQHVRKVLTSDNINDEPYHSEDLEQGKTIARYYEDVSKETA